MVNLYSLIVLHRKLILRQSIILMIILHLITIHSLWQGVIICLGDGHNSIEFARPDSCFDAADIGQINKNVTVRITTPGQVASCQGVPIDSYCNDDNLIMGKTVPHDGSLVLVASGTNPLTFKNKLKNTDCISVPHLNTPLYSFNTISLLI